MGGCCSAEPPLEEVPGAGWARGDMESATFRENMCAYHIGRDVCEDYEFADGTLGVTGFDYVSVRKVKSKATGKFFACKTFLFELQSRAERRESMESLRTEVQLLSTLDHPNIIRPFATYEDVEKNAFHIIMELCGGGDLNGREFSEQEAARIIYKILNAIVYCHSRSIVHRDIKTENILFDAVEGDAEVKLIDFGMSRRFVKGEGMHEQIGTVYTVAPEVLVGEYSEKCDMWSIGVVAFIMLTGESPFEGPTEQATVDNLCAARYAWPRDCSASAEAREFVYHLLKVDPYRRWSATRALISPFIKKVVQEAPQRSPLSRRPSFGIKMVHTLRRYERSKGLRKLGLMITAYTFDPNMVRDLRTSFLAMDPDATGVITKAQLRQALTQVYSAAKKTGQARAISHPDLASLAQEEEEKVPNDPPQPAENINEMLGMSEREFDDLFRAMDVDRKGVISYAEFLGATIEMCGNFTQDRLRETFNKLDVDNSGHITVGNLKTILGSEASTHDIDKMVREADLNGNDQIDLGEFLRLMGVKESDILEQEKKNIEGLPQKASEKAAPGTPGREGSAPAPKAPLTPIDETSRL